MSEIAKTIGEFKESYEKRVEKKLFNIRKNQEIAEHLIPRLDSFIWVNNRLLSLGRGDLKLSGPAVPLPQLTSIHNPFFRVVMGTFGYGFHMLNDRNETIATLQDLRSKGLEKGGHMPDDHRSKPAFHRALVIAPAVIINLAADITARETTRQKFDVEVFLAHAIMSRLVDKTDPGVLLPNGEVNTSYLIPDPAKQQ